MPTPIFTLTLLLSLSPVLCAVLPLSEPRNHDQSSTNGVSILEARSYDLVKARGDKKHRFQPYKRPNESTPSSGSSSQVAVKITKDSRGSSFMLNEDARGGSLERYMNMMLFCLTATEGKGGTVKRGMFAALTDHRDESNTHFMTVPQFLALTRLKNKNGKHWLEEEKYEAFYFERVAIPDHMLKPHDNNFRFPIDPTAILKKGLDDPSSIQKKVNLLKPGYPHRIKQQPTQNYPALQDQILIVLPSETNSRPTMDRVLVVALTPTCIPGAVLAVNILHFLIPGNQATKNWQEGQMRMETIPPWYILPGEIKKVDLERCSTDPESIENFHIQKGHLPNVRKAALATF